MNLDLYSDRAKQAIQSAQSLALARRHQQFAPEHLLKVLLEERGGLARNLITAAGGDAKRAEADTETALSKRAQVSGGSGQLYLDGDTARVFAAAEQAAKKAGDQFVTTERLLQGLAKEGGVAKTVLNAAGVKADGLDAAINDLRKGKTSDSAGAEDAYVALKRYATAYLSFFNEVRSFVERFYDRSLKKEEYHKLAQSIIDPEEKNTPANDFVTLLAGLRGKHLALDITVDDLVPETRSSAAAEN